MIVCIGHICKPIDEMICGLHVAQLIGIELCHFNEDTYCFYVSFIFTQLSDAKQ